MKRFCVRVTPLHLMSFFGMKRLGWTHLCTSKLGKSWTQITPVFFIQAHDTILWVHVHNNKYFFSSLILVPLWRLKGAKSPSWPLITSNVRLKYKKGGSIYSIALVFILGHYISIAIKKWFRYIVQKLIRSTVCLRYPYKYLLTIARAINDFIIILL